MLRDFSSSKIGTDNSMTHQSFPVVSLSSSDDEESYLDINRFPAAGFDQC